MDPILADRMADPYTPVDSNDPADPNDPALCYYILHASKSDEKLGLRFVRTEVVHVIPSSWADKNGVQEDDEIWEVDGKRYAPDESLLLKDYLVRTRPISIRFKRPKFKDTYYELVYDGTEQFGLVFSGDVVTEVVPEQFAAVNDVVVSDQIIEICGILFENLSGETVASMLKNATVDLPVRIHFKRPAAVDLQESVVCRRVKDFEHRETQTGLGGEEEGLPDGTPGTDEMPLMEGLGNAVERSGYTSCLSICCVAPKHAELTGRPVYHTW